MNNYSFVKGWASCRRSSLLFLLVVCWTPILSAQKITVKGTVSDASAALPGVTVTIKNQPQTGTISDSKGHYQLLAAPSDTLVISFVGCKTAYIPIQGRSIIPIYLVYDTTNLQEVRVNAGYYSVKEKERTGSIARITSADIETQPVTNVLATMQGRMAGVHVTQTTGVPGGGFDIQIRGINSLRNDGNAPLYIIDGVPYSSDPIGSGQNSPVLPARPSPLNSINPDQIESIEVLKDADATSIYGSRGANGVVLLTTKKGKAGKTSFSTTLSRGAGQVTRFMELLNTQQYLAMRKEAFANDGRTEYPANAYDVNGTWDPNRYTNWQKELLGATANFTDLQAAVNGGSENSQFLLSSNFNEQTTVFPGDFKYRKINVHTSFNHRSTNQRFRLQFSTAYTIQNNLQPLSDLMISALSLAPNAPPLYTVEGALNFENSSFDNPVASFAGKYQSKLYDLIANTVLAYKITADLEIKSSLGYTALNNDEITTRPSTMYDPAAGIGPENSGMIAGRLSRKSWIAEPQINWKKQLGKIKWDALLGSSFQYQEGDQLVQFGSGFTSNSLISNIASASRITIFANETTQYKYQAFFGRLNANCNDKYILNLTARRDGSSRFGPGKQFAHFGAVGGAWLFSKEKILSQSKLLSFGKLRSSYGITGSDQIGDYQFLDTYASNGVNYNGAVGLQPSRLYNPDFGWESNKKFEVALETGFLNDRIFLTASWYRNTSSNQLVGLPLPGTTGFTSIQANLDAVVENKGTELSLRTLNIQSKAFNWSTNFNISFVKNKLLSYPDLATSTYKNTLVVGQPLNIKKMYHYTGMDPETGTYTFEDVDGDGKFTTAGDRTTVKDLNPAFFGGLQNQWQYKGFQLDVLFQFVKQLNYNEIAFFNAPGTFRNQPTSVLDHWQQSGDVAQHQLYTNGTNAAAVSAYDRYKNSDAAISDASYVRLKNLSLSYNLPQQWIKNLSCRMFLQGQNLLTITKYKGADPEFKSVGYLPPLRMITAGTQITF